MTRTVKLLFALFTLLFSAAIACAADNQVIRLATTTSTVNSGLLDKLLPNFEQESGYQVHVIAVGTGKALRMGRDGDVDVVLVHAPAAEQKFVADGYGEQRFAVMYNSFVILGPAEDPAGVKKAKTTSDVLAKIHSTNAFFVSRGDDSGTHKKELSLWKDAGLTPSGDWYREAGQGMGKVIQIADEMNAYTLADKGTWLAYREKSRLRITFQSDTKLHNPYGIIEVSKSLYPDLNHSGAEALITWITSKDAQQQIADYRIHDEQLFVPSAAQTAMHLDK
ncbi:substrate-binding domain-containing protein [Solemya velum gill symbiont]|uniref:ABC-type cobalamin/Fe3-siderophor transporter TupCBA, subunit A n=1 Tax=Solemya velum gill symbiont TaxID=2340 RepID=A0A0B0HAM7_SOVGS|nr:substrate-binding domain-containing protein [Solemya velum gill symbiont]KHF25732.1 ABC-type cobalamin/Fe3-siderophor transporter TupCBA, subunit A [Solemya velum gill symbiont]OOY35670.1 tungsten ABC transporter substrate-binding protein [Solemya velum gill symbiont]OOY38298.1 tungsten ABC transporter substrate-binding protein [Solemya velum gill symbiont]OOY40785.1 tungsten ABC transporter substrate-binding protein [Solemya velum gill symbiont]OOY43466.1 tungsten ABC transporter substrate